MAILAAPGPRLRARSKAILRACDKLSGPSSVACISAGSLNSPSCSHPAPARTSPGLTPNISRPSLAKQRPGFAPPAPEPKKASDIKAKPQ